MCSYEIIITALAMAFCWVEYVVKFLDRLYLFFEIEININQKPFNCIKCMTGWYALILGLFVYGLAGVVFLPIGVFVGAIFEAIKMRWL